jgi:hypothetical protein
LRLFKKSKKKERSKAKKKKEAKQLFKQELKKQSGLSVFIHFRGANPFDSAA